MKYFTSDWHLNEERIGLNGKPNLFFRNFDSIKEQNQIIIDSVKNLNLTKNDILYHLGDVVYRWDDNLINMMEDLRNSCPAKWVLILGNYDDNINQLSHYFDKITDAEFLKIKDRKYFLHHYPIKCKTQAHCFGVTGHIHGLWKVQKNMVNVGVDAWNFNIVDENTIDFVRTACEKFYDENVFPYSS